MYIYIHVYIILLLKPNYFMNRFYITFKPTYISIKYMLFYDRSIVKVPT